MTELRACGLGQKDRLVRVTLLWLCATGCPVRRREVDEATRKSFNYPVIYWRSYTAKHKQSTRFLGNLDDNFLSQ